MRRSADKTTKVCDRPLRICVVFDEEVSARNAEFLIANVAFDYECETQSLRFDQLEAPKSAVAAARRVAGTDILVLAARGDRELPSHIRLWLGLCLGLRDEGQEGALVALVTEVEGAADLHSSIVDYLETIAIIGGVAFFARKQPSPLTLKVGGKDRETKTERLKSKLGVSRIGR